MFQAWDALLKSKSVSEITSQSRPSQWSLSQVIAHLMAWQQISIARVEAALTNSEPAFPPWLGGADPYYAEDHVDEFNAAIQRFHRGRSWPDIHQDWTGGFLRFLQLSETVSEEAMFDAVRFPWLNGYPLSAVLEGSLEHHQEHLDRSSAPPG